MQVNKILSVNYNNRIANQKEQKNPNFGKLLIDDGVSTKVLQEITHNEEIKKLVRLFDDVGINLKAIQYITIENSCELVEGGMHFRLVDPKVYKNMWANVGSATRLAVDGYNEKEIIENIKNLPTGTAIEHFNNDYNKFKYPKYFKIKEQKYNYKLDTEYTEKQKALEDVKNFNKTLSNKSFWKKLSDLFN